MLFIGLSLLFAARSWATTTSAPYYGNATYGQTVTYGNNTYAETYLAPTAEGTTWYWSQVITPAILGTVFVVINDHNQTITTTSTNSAAVASNTQYLQNGTLSLLSRTDVDARGTVTTLLPTGGDGEVVVAYPTPYFTVVRPISWQGLFPEVQHGATCCNSHDATASPVPQNHYSFPQLTGSTNSADPRGWLYLMATSPLAIFSGSQNLSSLFAPATISSVKQHCPYFRCAEVSSALGAEAVRTVGALLETSTVHVTGTFSTSASPAATAKQSEETAKTSAKSSVEVDPVLAPTPTPSTAPPVSKTSAENVGVAFGQSLDTTIPTGIDTTTASKEGATGVQAVDNLLTIDSDFNVIRPTTASTQLASKIQDPLPGIDAPILAGTTQPAPKSSYESPDAVPSRTTANIGDLIGSLLQSDGSSNTQGVQTAVDSAPSQLVVGSTSLALQTTELATTVSGVLTNVPAMVIGSQTVAIGASGSVGNIPVAVITSGSETAVVIDGSQTQILPQTTAVQGSATQPRLIIGSSTITANANSQYIIAGQTLAPGYSITVSGTPIALEADNPLYSVLVVGTSASILLELPTITPRPTLPPIVVGSSTFSPNDFDQYVVASQTLEIGFAITIGNTPMALQTDGSTGLVLVVGTSSSILQQQPESIEEAVPIVVGGSTLTANSASEYMIAGQTLKPGSSITLGSGSSASVVELQTSGSKTFLVAGTSSSILQQQASPVLTVGPAKITPLSNSEYLVGTQTLLPGASAITVSGLRYSLASDGGQLVAGSSTTILTSEADMGGYIWSALGGSSAASSTSTRREASTAVPSGSSRTSSDSGQLNASQTAEAGAADVARPFFLWSLIALSLLVRCRL